MYRKLIVGYNGTDESRDALAMAMMLARGTGAALILACTIRRDFPVTPGSDRFVAAQEGAAADLLESAAQAIEDGISAETRVVRGSSPAQALHDLAEEESADLLALGSTHRGTVGRVLAGSTAERMLHGAPCAIAVAPRAYVGEAADVPHVVAAGFNALPESKRAVTHARDLAEACGATLRLIAVQEPDLFFGYADVPAPSNAGDMLQSERERLDRALADVIAELPASIRTQGQVLTGAAEEILAAEAAKGVDVLVLGSRGYGPLRRVLLGGTSSKLMRSAPCPVLAVPRAAE